MKSSVVALSLALCAAPAHAFAPSGGRSSRSRTPAAGAKLRKFAIPPLRRAAPPQMAAAAVATRLGAALASPLASLTRPVVAVVVALVVMIAWAFKRLNTPSRVYDREANSVGREYDAWTSEGVLEYYWGEHIHLGYYEESQRKGPFYGGKDFIEAKYDFTEKMLEFSKTDMPAKALEHVQRAGVILGVPVLALGRGRPSRRGLSREAPRAGTRSPHSGSTAESLARFPGMRPHGPAKVGWPFHCSASAVNAQVLDVGCGIGGTSRYIAKRFPEAEVTGITISAEQQRRATALATER